MRKRMAIKVLHPEMIRLPEVVQRFENEAIAAAHIDSPHVVTATDFGKLADGSFYLALEFIEGKSLREVLAGGPLELGRALHIGRQIATALSRAHQLKIVHRDLKPENVMLVDRDGDTSFVKVLDFGIAKISLGEVIGEAQAAAEPGKPVLTQAGMVYGTPEYMAPEQALGQPVDSRADLYALGVMLYEMLTGRRPFEADSKVALLGMQVTAPVPKMTQKTPEANIPPEVEALVNRLLAKEASERLGDARELIEGINASLVHLAATGRIDPAYAPPPMSSQVSHPGLVTGPSPVLPGSMAGDLGRDGASPASGAGGTAKRIEGLLPGRTWLVAAGAGTLGLIVLVVAIIVVLRGREAEGGADGGLVANGSATTGGSSTTAPEAPPSAPVADAIAMIERGDYGSGIKKLEELGDQVAGREDVHRALLSAYGATDRDKEAMRQASLVLKGNPNLDLEKEKKLRTEVRNTAVKTGSKDPDTQAGADLAWGLLENDMGPVGWTTIWDIGFGATGEPYPDARARAKAAYKKPGAKAKMGPANAVTYDLFSVGRTCAAKPLFERAAQDGDDRTLDLLKQLEAPVIVKSGWKTRDALGCVHDGSLKRTIASLQENLAKKK
jgi:eukaryotic-like serine/threonine-protein kinase